MGSTRRSQRVTCHARISGAGFAALIIRGDVRDVSPSGLSLATRQPVRKGQTLHLSFRLSTGLVEAVGEVRWVTKRKDKPTELGIRFVRIPITSTNAINAAIDAALSR